MLTKQKEKAEISQSLKEEKAKLVRSKFYRLLICLENFT